MAAQPEKLNMNKTRKPTVKQALNFAEGKEFVSTHLAWVDACKILAKEVRRLQIMEIIIRDISHAIKANNDQTQVLE